MLTTAFIFAAGALPLALSAPAPVPYIGLNVYTGSLKAPCDPNALAYDLHVPLSWLDPTTKTAESHCLPADLIPGTIHNITCVTRQAVPTKGETYSNGTQVVLDAKTSEMTKCDMWGYTDVGCSNNYTDKYWVAGRNDKLAGGAAQSWIWTEEERESGPDLLDIRSFQIDCRP